MRNPASESVVLKATSQTPREIACHRSTGLSLLAHVWFTLDRTGHRSGACTGRLRPFGYEQVVTEIAVPSTRSKEVSTLRNLKVVRVIALVVSAVVGSALAIFIGDRDNGPDAGTYIRNSEAFASFSSLFAEEAFGRNYWQAGYSGFLRLLSGLGDFWLPGVRVAQVMMVVSMAFMAYLLTKNISEKVATFTLIVVAFSPSLMWFSLVIGYEVLLGWQLTLVLVLLWRLVDSRKPWLVASLAGLVFGLSLIVQFKAAVVLPVLIYLVMKSHRRAVPWLLTGILAPVAAWMVRNYIALGSAAPWSNNSSVNIWLGNRPDGTGGYPVHESVDFPPPNRYLSETLEFASEAVRPFLELQVRKAMRFWYPNVPVDFHLEVPHLLDWLLVLSLFVYALVLLVLFVLFLASLIWRVKSGLRSMLPLAVVVVLMFLVNLPFIVEPRYRIPVEAILISVCVPTLMELIKRNLNKASTNGHSNSPESTIPTSPSTETKETGWRPEG